MHKALVVAAMLMAGAFAFGKTALAYDVLYQNPNGGSANYSANIPHIFGPISGTGASTTLDVTGTPTLISTLSFYDGSFAGNMPYLEIRDATDDSVLCTSDASEIPSPTGSLWLFPFPGCPQIQDSDPIYITIDGMGPIGWKTVTGTGETNMIIYGGEEESETVDTVTFTYPVADSTIGTKWRYEFDFHAATTTGVYFEISLCPYLTSCANMQTVPSSFVATEDDQQGTYLVLAPVTPGMKTATVTMKDEASGASLDSDSVSFTVANTAGSNTDGSGPFATSTVETSPVHCEINLPDFVFGDDSSVDPCALAWWLVVPNGDLIGSYVAELRVAFDNTEPYHTITSVFGAIAGTEIATTTRPTITIPNPFSTSTEIAVVSTSTWDFTEGTNWQNIRDVATVVLVIGWTLGMLALLLGLFKTD